MPHVPDLRSPAAVLLRPLLLAAVVAVGALTSCQTTVSVDVAVEADGSGAVAVGVGLDAEALAEVGDLGAQLRVDDLRDAGWVVTGPTEEADGYTWVRATKPFADPAAAAVVLDEVNGAGGAFGGWEVAKGSSAWSTSFSVTGSIDLTRGIDALSDAPLDETLGDRGLTTAIDQLEQEQGRPVSEMVDVQVSVAVPGASRTYAPSLADAEPTPVMVTSSEATGLVTILSIAVVLLVVVPVLVWLRLRATRSRLPAHR